MSIDSHLALQIRTLRKRAGHTLEQLAQLSGVSRSMISLIEREETSPTAAVLDKLADALGVTLAALFAAAGPAPAVPLARRADQPVWQDPASGYLRRQVSPAGHEAPVDLVEVIFPAGETVVFEPSQRQVETQQQLWLLEGQMQISVGAQSWALQCGDCLAMPPGPRIVFHNPAAQPARYALVLHTAAVSARRV